MKEAVSCRIAHMLKQVGRQDTGMALETIMHGQGCYTLRLSFVRNGCYVNFPHKFSDSYLCSSLSTDYVGGWSRSHRQVFLLDQQWNLLNYDY